MAIPASVNMLELLRKPRPSQPATVARKTASVSHSARLVRPRARRCASIADAALALSLAPTGYTTRVKSSQVSGSRIAAIGRPSFTQRAKLISVASCVRQNSTRMPLGGEPMIVANPPSEAA